MIASELDNILGDLITAEFGEAKCHPDEEEIELSLPSVVRQLELQGWKDPKRIAIEILRSILKCPRVPYHEYWAGKLGWEIHYFWFGFADPVAMLTLEGGIGYFAMIHL